MGRVVSTRGDLLKMDDLLTPCAGTLSTIAFLIYKLVTKKAQLVMLYFAGSW